MTRSTPQPQAHVGANAGCFEIDAPHDGFPCLAPQIVRQTPQRSIVDLTNNPSNRTNHASTLRRSVVLPDEVTLRLDWRGRRQFRSHH